MNSVKQFHVWFFRDSNEVLLTDDPGPPDGGILIGVYERPAGVGWGWAGEAAKRWAEEHGSLIIYSATFGEES